MSEEDKQEEKSKIMFGETERQILANLSSNVSLLVAAIDRLTQQIILTKKD
ncbi:MAG: hypothetical protein HQ580_03000 [Planctomycetes bacterium]|nr:hypothetical protein [Planctomycetota bacterium]